MGTQGMLTIMKDDEVLYKVICGCNGYNISNLAREINNMKVSDISDVMLYYIALRYVGCPDCLVVQSKKRIIYQGRLVRPNEYSDTWKRYIKYFRKYDFNPRWDRGEVEYFTAVNCKGGVR